MQATCGGNQHFIADLVPQRVVDDLEVVQVEHEHADQSRVALEPLKSLIQSIREQHAIGEASQRVSQSLALHGHFRLSAFAHIAHQHLSFLQHTRGRIEHRLVFRLDPCIRAVLTPIPEAGGLAVSAGVDPRLGSPCQRPVFGMDQLGDPSSDQLFRRISQQRNGSRRDVREHCVRIRDREGV